MRVVLMVIEMLRLRVVVSVMVMVILTGGAVWEEEEGLPHHHAEVWRDNPLGEMAHRLHIDCTTLATLYLYYDERRDIR